MAMAGPPAHSDDGWQPQPGGLAVAQCQPSAYTLPDDYSADDLSQVLGLGLNQ